MNINPGKIIFETADINNVVITLSSDTWRNHILLRHPEVKGYIDDIKRSVEDPHIISRRASANLYRVVDAGREEYSGLYLTTAVNFSNGTVSSAYFEPDIRPNESIIYLKTGTTLR